MFSLFRSKQLDVRVYIQKILDEMFATYPSIYYHLKEKCDKPSHYLDKETSQFLADKALIDAKGQVFFIVKEALLQREEQRHLLAEKNKNLNLRSRL